MRDDLLVEQEIARIHFDNLSVCGHRAGLASASSKVSKNATSAGQPATTAAEPAPELVVHYVDAVFGAVIQHTN